MDATTAIVILIFVISIFSGFGHNKGYKPPAPPPVPPPLTEVSKPEVSALEPPANYSALEPVSAQNAIFNFIQKYQSPELSAAITTCIMKHSAAFDLNPKLVASLMARESRFNPRALSPSGAMGLGQLLPSTAKNLGVEDGFDVDQNTYGTVRYLKSLIDRFKGRVTLALAGYLEGPNQVMRSGCSNKALSYVGEIFEIYRKI